MPIKGLSDRGLAFPEIGQIRKGAKKSERAPGKDLTYFRVEFDELEKVAASNFRAAYKDQPTAIRILLPFNEIERTWDPWLEAYTAGRLVARSDGEWIVYQLDDMGDLLVHNGVNVKTGERVPHPANGIAGNDYRGTPVKFKPTGRLKVIVPELKRAAYLTVMTTSTHDIANISSQLAAFKELNGGQLAGIPFILRRRPKAISTPSENGQRVRRVKWLLSIEVDPDWAAAKFGQLNNLALPSGFEPAALPAGDIEEIIDYDEDEVIEEVQPETINQETGEVTGAVELIDPMGDWAVAYAAKEWNKERGEAAREIAAKKLGKRIDKREFMQIVNPQPA
jgi:hypothetical protein